MSKLNIGNGSCKEQLALYGTRFAKDGGAKYLISKCDEHIEKCKMWLQNTEQLLSLVKEEQLNARDEEIRQFLSRYTPEEIAAFQNGSSN